MEDSTNNARSPLLQAHINNTYGSSNDRPANKDLRITLDEGHAAVYAEVDTGEVESGFSLRKLIKYTGPGWLMSIAYIDPGNLEADLQSGASAGYKLLWLLFWAHAAGLLIQCLSARLGVVTGKHLAQQMRAHYPFISPLLWFIAEIAIIGSDIQEIIGTAIALRIIFGLPLWVGTLLTALDSCVFMMLQHFGVRKLEAFFMLLISVMATCFWVEMVQSRPNLGAILEGTLKPTLPDKSIVQAVAMLGAVIMPHSSYLHSALVMSRRVGDRSARSIPKIKEANFYFFIESALALLASFLINLALVVVFAQVYYSPDEEKPMPGLYDASDVLTRTLGGWARYLFALGLLAAGQSSTMAGTIAGGYVMEGFFGRIFSSAWQRLAVTRSIALVPSMLVAVLAVQHMDMMGELLNVLQSVCLPVTLIPLLRISDSEVMGDFRMRPLVKIIAWLVAALLTASNIYLLGVFLEELPNRWMGLGFGMAYMVLLGYLMVVPLSRDHAWVMINGHKVRDSDLLEGPARDVVEDEGGDEVVVDTTQGRI
ncbi:uncharacterized protein VTP21DRAFT_96 [Calcarisporiella thermophila]|uniref:uncharacterized protein n=1 Tax=Calcarisporiella thermophila TaxID=911321 RepID=UPI003742A34F